MTDPSPPWPDAPRHLPGEPFPPYRHLPGRTPHPVRDAQGHSHGAPGEPALHVPPGRWREDRAYLRGVDLFHAGYLWEAHEAWEGIWRASPDAVQRAFLRGLIQLAAALLKDRLGNAHGVGKLVARARDNLRGVPARPYMGLDVADLLRAVDRWAGTGDEGGRGPAPRLVLDR